ncbi:MULTISPECIES: TatD family hydrolase [Pseudidiomarina]|uniref:Sec-independent protein translocase TatD n=4 Tax=Pseudidiomarina TaxID=2800384 RepID=A0A368V040_9GAMM|nr:MULTISPECIES: TatD family hydrolase [Pseudidiomarina]MDT7526494.1 TatD family hydrolase [Pseudidiomarina sp. GXY010]MDX1525998.1 TatD family hydrolase [Pseudidiomarina maritima]PWW14137.1 Sec-independent protein translocase TatD [Pseudidiomarina maritima]RBP91951.1 Sec-independent protein translocase TatD [Pseudidiomarina tainanensis]RCW33715.1 Sec-independent protein translocase TatD [Pseudidiomarina tainanensis]
MSALRWFDVGVNLTNPKLLVQAEQVIARGLAAGVERQLVIGTNVLESEQALALCERFPQQLVACVGIHPHDAAASQPTDLARLRELAQHPAVVAIGECGLDFNRNYSPAAIQQQVFTAQLELAAELKLPVYLHERDAQAQQLALLKPFLKSIPRMLAHCFTGGEKELANYLDLGCYIGITGWLCDERRGTELQQAVPWIPANRLLLETDAPFLLPRTIRPRPKYNEPSLLPAIGEYLAQLRQQEVTTIAAQCWQNSLEFIQQ